MRQQRHDPRQDHGAQRAGGQPGDFVVQDTPLAFLWSGTVASEEVDLAITASFLLGPQRTLVQDVTFGINELVEMAVRALSPTISDPFTAMMYLACSGELSAYQVRIYAGAD